MNRRQFTQSLAALVAAPALPARALMAAPTATAAAAPPNLYTWSAMIARVHGKCSPAMLERMLRVDATQAGALFNKLIANNIVGHANALGVSQAKALMPPPTGAQVNVPEPVVTEPYTAPERVTLEPLSEDRDSDAVHPEEATESDCDEDSDASPQT